jgi:hypothetical protein
MRQITANLMALLKEKSKLRRETAKLLSFGLSHIVIFDFQLGTPWRFRFGRKAE